ncbi:MAG: dihydroorotase [Microbacterium sp. SCN 70-200]|uniref:dihydroorotase n=1 Tax=unclassified Microbacterium TaxID=2609290 RepID=UPI00086CF9C1|nr:MULTISPECIES: dihydroorotase [unclassified Microbacterium]MBN9214284.1 dihydroorotase [Microbacterium sp.]ODT40933.1 MAG: dihydroorotase [Microbacterium sp. SCN 70-200]OJV83897.1 MAG: dihydroorotase [Microbacterium sp. 70-16]
MSETYLIRGAKLNGADAADLVVTDGRIAEVGTGLSRAGATVIDADGLIALPGLVDLHTHLREPGYEASETILTGSRAAASGGYTTVFAMPNTSPVADTAGVVEQELALGEAAGYVNVQPIGAVTVGQKGERLAELGAMASSRARVRVFSDDGFCVFDPLIMRRALEYVKAFDGVVAQHAQDPRLTEGAQMNEGTVSAELGLAGWPAVAEESIIARDVLLAEHVGSRLHVCHLSTAGSVDIIRWAKKRGVNVTAEVTPHHLLLTEELVRGYDARFKVNPPLRRDEDVQAVREGLADGTIDIVATDHAPHPDEAKSCEWPAAANGMVGLESALRVVQQAVVDTGMLTWNDVARVMSTAPARIGRRGDAGTPLAAGEIASLTLHDPAPRRTFAREDLRGRSVNSPYLGRELPGEIRWTLFRGVATVADGALVELAAGELA